MYAQKTRFRNIVSRNKRILREQQGQDLDADADDLANRLERQMDDDEGQPGDATVYEESFCDLSFDEWLQLSMRVSKLTYDYIISL